MTTEKSLAIIEQAPEEVIIRGKGAATQLQSIVSSRDKKLLLGGKQYLFFEDWQTIGKFYGVTAKVTHTEELRDEGKLIGFLATAVALVNGVEVSAADAECTYDEANWANKPRFQLRSMAQTRACAKSLRNCLGWVAVLAGYEATPAEEMADVKPSTQGHWCPIHNTVFFKKGRMKGYAHKIEGTDEWCNEDKNEDKQETTIETPSVDAKEILGELTQVLASDEIPEQVTNAQELMKWAFNISPEYTPSWVRQQMGWGTKIISNEMAVQAYEQLKEKIKKGGEPLIPY